MPTQVSRVALAALLQDPVGEIHFQPIRHLQSGRPVGFEALARFPGPFGPAEWIEAAHRFGQIERLDRLLFRAAVTAFENSGLPGRLFVNLEAGHLALLPRWLSDVSTLMIDRIVIEVTERDPSPPQGWCAAGRTVRAQGYAISLDDFVCSLRFVHHARHLEPHFVKVDRTLVERMLRDPHTAFSRMGRWVRHARRIGATLIAEGVQDQQQARTLWQCGFGYGQGFGLGRPAPAQRWLGGVDVWVAECTKEEEEADRANTHSGEVEYGIAGACWCRRGVRCLRLQRISATFPLPVS